VQALPLGERPKNCHPDKSHLQVIETNRAASARDLAGQALGSLKEFGLSCSKFSENGADWASVRAHEFQGQGDQLVITFFDVIQLKVFQHTHVPLTNHLVAVQGFAVGGIYACAVDPNSAKAIKVSGAKAVSWASNLSEGNDS
jgi:hypothetical protein